jgi:hypothetical protein
MSTGVKLRHTNMVISQRTERHTLWGILHESYFENTTIMSLPVYLCPFLVTNKNVLTAVGFATLFGAFYTKTFGINKNDRVIGQLDLALFDLHCFAEISPKKCYNMS